MDSQEALMQSIEKFKEVQAEMARKAIQELEEQVSRVVKPKPPAITHRQALKETIETFKLVQAELCRTTERLEAEGRGKKVQPDQMTRFLKGDQDIVSETLESIIWAMPRKGRIYFYGLMLGTCATDE